MPFILLVIDTNFLCSGKSHFYRFTDCQPGYYGNKCEQVCSGHCLNKLVCNYIDGTCSDGCKAGYIGKLCHDCKIFYLKTFVVFDIHLQLIT